MTLMFRNNAVERLQKAHDAGGVVYTLKGDGTLRAHAADEPLAALGIIFNKGLRRKTIAAWLDNATWIVGPSRSDGWIGTFDIDHWREGIFVTVGWFQDPEPTMGPVMSFGAAFMDHESWYSEYVRELFGREAEQLHYDNLISTAHEDQDP